MSQSSIFSLETRFPIDPDPAGFPFRRELSLAPLAAAWKARACGECGVTGALAQRVHEELQRAPGLLASIEDPAVIARHRELVDVLMSKVFPTAFWEQDYAAVLVPFTLQSVYATPGFERLFVGDDGMLRGQLNVDAHTWTRARLLRAYGLILKDQYDIDLRFEYPLIATVPDPESGLERHFRIVFDFQFLEVVPSGPRRPLAEPERRRVLANLADPDVLAELIPPGGFAFRGFVVVKALDVTDQEVLSSLKRDLIERESIVSTTRFQSLQQKLRTLFRRPDLRLGLAAIQGDQVFLLNYDCRLDHECIFADSLHKSRRDFAGSVYARAVSQVQPLIIHDLAAYAVRTPVEETLLGAGARNVVVAPLSYQDEVIGILELTSPHPGDLDAMSTLKLREVLPLFSMAVRRSLDELNTRIQAVIKEKCTAIHPSVEWRFRRAVLNSIERDSSDDVPDMEPIVFKDVYPLYGATDIRGSSLQRNLAIQADLLAHLRLAREVVQAAREARALPILDELGYRIDKHARHVELTLNSGDEVTVLAFLRQHVEPLFDHMGRFGSGVRERIEAYRAALDPQFGTLYRRRKDYEDSVTLINETVSAYLDAEQDVAQGMFPHYFEKQRTDGVDYSIYIGASLVESGEFDELYLRNLRLWQLLVTCGIARRAEAVRARLRVTLETTHLILVHGAPLSIRFRFDEKRFDVDGAYNVRYEVVKKRIDKAVVRGTDERVTQPGKIAIIYSQPAEAAEYREYLDYLATAGHLTGEIEELELGELQGVHGLRALRVGMDLSAPGPEPRGTARAAEEGVRAIGR